MYAIHTTSGFVLDSRPYGEADKTLSIFTRDFGLVTAIAQGIRFEKSKLRYYCQDQSFGVYSLVRGREFWRLTSAQAQGNASAPSNLQLMARVALLLRRLLHGEEASSDLFDAVQATSDFLATQGELPREELDALESVTVLRALNFLGYIGSDPILKPYLDHTPLTRELLASAATKRTALNAHINKALKESHL